MKKSLLGGLLFLTMLSTINVFAAGTTITKVPTPSTQIPIIDEPKKPIKGLIILNDFFALDEKNVYSINTARNKWIIIDTADRDTFQVILGHFAQDKNTIFYGGTILENADKKSFVVISGTHGYASDDMTVYGPQGVIEGADPDTFKLFTGKYGADAGHVYFEGKLLDADSATFQVIKNGLYAMDAQKVFYNGQLLRGVPVTGFVVKGDRAFASDGHVFFAGQVEKGAPLPGDENIPPVTNVINPPVENNPPLMSGETLYQKLFTEEGILAPYSIFVLNEWIFLLFLGLLVIGIYSALFVFFADRNDEEVLLGKVFLKILIALLVGGAIFWLATSWASLLISGIIGSLIGLIAFLSLCNVGGKIKTFFVTLLSCIALGFFVSIAIIILRITSNTPETISVFLTGHTVQTVILLGGIGIFLGSWLVRNQLKTSISLGVINGIIATLFSLLVIIFVYWLGPFSLIWTVILFSVLFGAFLWVLRFRGMSDMLFDTARIIRIIILLGVITGLLTWIVL